jgi:hypothetical protein
MFLKRSATTLVERDEDLDIVFNEHADGGKVDLPKHGLHQAAGEEGDSRAGGTPLAHEFGGIGGAALQDWGPAREKETVKAETGLPQDPAGEQGQVEQGRDGHGGRGETKRHLWLGAMGDDVLVPDPLEDLPIRHRGRTGGLTREASDAFLGVKIGPLVWREATGRFLTPQPEAAAGRIVLVASEFIGRADRQAKPAVRAIRKMRGRRFRIHGRLVRGFQSRRTR